MYSIAYLVYGIDVSRDSHVRELLEAHFNELYADKESDFHADPDTYFTDVLGCWNSYSGSGDPPVAIGASFGSFDAFGSYPLSRLTAKAASLELEEAKIKYSKAFSELPEDVRKVLTDNNIQPDVLVMWGTS